MENYLNLAKKLLEHEPEAKWLVEFFNYFLTSTNKYLHVSKSYLSLLKEIQYKLI